MKDNQAKYPQLRFKGFTDPWEQRKLGDAVSISSGVTGDATLQDGKYRLTRIESISQGMLNVARLGFTNEKPDQKYLLNLGDILYSNINSLSHIGKVALVDTAGIYHGINLLRFQMRNDVDSEFLFQRLNTMPMKSWAVSHANPAVSQASINQTELSKQPISSPTITEQQKIGSFFKQLDHLITLHQRKLAMLKELKQGYLQKLFPKNGSKFPQLRFAGFADAWEQRKLSDLTESHNSGVYIPKDQYGEGTNIIGVGDIYDSDVVDGQRYRLAPVKDKRFILHTNDLLYGESSLVPEGIARVVSVSEAGAGTAFAWHTRRFKVNQVTLNSRFLGLELDCWLPARSHLMRSSTKTALTGITTQDFFNTQIVYPSKPEQEKIATLINSLDTAIALHQRKLEKLQELKKGYLQKMFC